MHLMMKAEICILVSEHANTVLFVCSYNDWLPLGFELIQMLVSESSEDMTNASPMSTNHLCSMLRRCNKTILSSTLRRVVLRYYVLPAINHTHKVGCIVLHAKTIAG